MNKIEIDLTGVKDEQRLFLKFGDVLELGGPHANHPVDMINQNGWGLNWDALNDSLSYLDAGGIWGTSTKQSFPLQLCITHYEQLDVRAIEILQTKAEQYAKNDLLFEFTFL